ncbi:MAG: hypothetical protein AAGA58_10815 [Verrucomicrobiota bacterium]
MPSLDSWIDAAELKELANRVTTEAAPSPAVERKQNDNWKSQLEKIKAQASQSGLIRNASDPPEDTHSNVEEVAEGESRSGDFLSRAAEVYPRAKNLLGAQAAFFCDAASHAWPAEDVDEALVEVSAKIARNLDRGAFGGQWLESKSGMLWVFNSAQEGAHFWLSVFTQRAATHENLRFVAEAVRALAKQ